MSNNIAQGSDTHKLNNSVSPQIVHLNEVEQLAQVVDSGLKSQNFSEMNERLSTIPRNNNETETYVFKHPSVISRYWAIAVTLLVSAVFVYCLLIGSATALFSEELYTTGILHARISIVILPINFILILKIVSAIKFKSRFDAYEKLLGYKSFEFVNDLAIYTKYRPSLIIKDLKRAVRYKLIPQGHFSSKSKVFMITDKVYVKYIDACNEFEQKIHGVIENRNQVKSQNKKVDKIVEDGERYILKLHGYKRIVKHKNVYKNIEKMEIVVSMIFHEIGVKSHAQILVEFLKYYLSTSEKLLDAYMSFDKKSHLDVQSRREIETTINIVVNDLECILKKIYRSYETHILDTVETNGKTL